MISMPAKSSTARRLLGLARRLIKDHRGNTLAIIAAAVFPMLAMIGGGLDLARAYLVKSRINEACDAASLAGRRAMSYEDLSTAIPEATKFFNQNFTQGYLGSAPFTPSITRPDTGVIRVAASTTVPTTLMKIFGYTSMPVSVSCNATQNFDNIDIVLVLDVTGSMAQYVSGSRKIDSLRDAVMALYDELASAQTQLESEGLRVRYAIVPYSASVNVGKLVYDVNPSYIASSWTYDSRTANFYACGWQNQSTCVSYTYGPRTIDTSSFIAGNSVNVKPIIGNWYDNYTSWNGCIQERDTTSSITASSSNAYADIPGAAKDLDIDLVPSGPGTQWGPQWPQVTYDKDSWGNNASSYCPAAAKRLTRMSRSEMQDYVNNLNPVGGTYHDIGMIWGAHFISRGGIFASDNPTIYNDRPVNRYVIFMTDGILEPQSTANGPYGIEYLDRHIEGGTYGNYIPSGNGSDLEKRHTNRFLMACNAAKQGGASIWTIAFGLSAPDSLKECASNSDQWATSENRDALIAKFKEIGKNIGRLRLSQ